MEILVWLFPTIWMGANFLSVIKQRVSIQCWDISLANSVVAQDIGAPKYLFEAIISAPERNNKTNLKLKF